MATGEAFRVHSDFSCEATTLIKQITNFLISSPDFNKHFDGVVGKGVGKSVSFAFGHLYNSLFICCF